MCVFALTSRDRKVDPAQYWRLHRVIWWGDEGVIMVIMIMVAVMC